MTYSCLEHTFAPQWPTSRCLGERRYSHATNTSTSTSQDCLWKLVKQVSPEFQLSFKNKVQDLQGGTSPLITDYNLPQGLILQFLVRGKVRMEANCSESVMGKGARSALADTILVPCTKTYQLITIISPNMEKKNVCQLLQLTILTLKTENWNYE